MATTVERLCADSPLFKELYSHFRPFADTKEEDVAHLEHHMQCVILGMREIFEADNSVRVLYYLYVDSPFAPVVRMIINRIYSDVTAKYRPAKGQHSRNET